MSSRISSFSVGLGHASIKSTEAYLRASPAEKFEILKTSTPPSIRPVAFPGAQDHLMRLLNGK